MKAKVAVAMSGGVDSSTTAALLASQGYEVVGITMLHYDSSCRRAERAVEDAARVCRTLGIEHHVVDLRGRFEDIVIKNFISEYLAGRTPNPCVLCNRTIKWGELLQEALKRGADYFATGHYVILRLDETSGRRQLWRSHHSAKDQSYALWRLTQEQLARTIFPLGTYDKSEVRAMAASFGLPVAQKEESQDICCIPDDDYAAFLRERLGEEGLPGEGEIVDKDGVVLGRHRGFPFYTIGQRKGLGVAVGRPLYVVDIDAAANRLRVGDKQESAARGLVAEETNWVGIERPCEGRRVTAHIRYNDRGAAAVLTEIAENRVTVLFDEPRTAVTPGQSAVFYAGDLLLGGGIIRSALR